MNKLIRTFILFVFVLAGIQQSANADNAPKLYVFGDSLSDSGNDYILTGGFAPPPVFYNNGRFSNGPVAVEYLWNILNWGNAPSQLKPSLAVTNPNPCGENAVNFAYGGANSDTLSDYVPAGRFSVPGVGAQVNGFIKACNYHVPQTALYVIWAGANDYLDEGLQVDTGTITNIKNSILALYSAGARNIIVPNLPNLGVIPAITDPSLPSQYPPAIVGPALTALTIQHNADLLSTVKSIRSTYPKINLIYVDIFSLAKNLSKLLNSSMGPAGDCLWTGLCSNPPTSFSAPNDMYWDVEHPTTDVHKLLALQILQQLISE